MTLVKSSRLTPSAAGPTAWRSPARVEKIRLSNGLDGERHSAPQQEDFASAKLARTRLYPNETTDVVSERDDLRLIPAFVTQVLAQIARPPAPDAPSALLAYRNGISKIALVYDRDA